MHLMFLWNYYAYRVCSFYLTLTLNALSHIYLHTLEISAAPQLSALISIFSISFSTHLFFILSHLVTILSLWLKAFIISFRLFAVYSLSSTYLEINFINFLLFLDSFRSTVCHAHSLFIRLTWIGLWSDMFLLSKKRTFTLFYSKPYMITTSIFVFFWPLKPCLVQLLAS